MERVVDALAAGEIGLVLVEPVQARGGVRAPPPGWLRDVAAATRHHGAVLCLDEVYTGIGRTGALLAGPGEGVVPDLVCIGKALGGGFPVSACVGTTEVMDTWGASRGEALHTQTFLGHPVGCAAALAVLDATVDHDLPGLAHAKGERLATRLAESGFRVRGRGLMLGVEVAHSLSACRGLAARGYLALPAGMSGEVVSLTPPVTLTDDQADGFVAALVATATPTRRAPPGSPTRSGS